MATWLDEARGLVERTGRDIKRKGEELDRTYRPVVERAVSAAEAKLQAHRAALDKVLWRADLALAPKKAAPGSTSQVRAAPPKRSETTAQAERRAMVDRAIPFPLSAAINPRGLGAPGVFPAVIDVNGVAREVTDDEFARSIPQEVRPLLAQGEKLQYGAVDPGRFTGPNRHLNMRVSDVGRVDQERLATAMREYPAPGTTRQSPARTGDASFVGMENSPLPGGWVDHWVGPKAIINSTQPIHVFNPGYAVRMPVQNADGTTRIVTVSAGTNPVTGLLNQLAGPGQFGRLDKRVAAAARQR